jgi:hypothetical protein
MDKLTEKIYLVDEYILKIIESEFENVDRKDWYILLKNKNDDSLWRLDVWDKYQTQFLIKLDSFENWSIVNDKELRMEFLKNQKGISDERCTWNGCERNSLLGIKICEFHALIN